jgi:hypothetical protein
MTEQFYLELAIGAVEAEQRERSIAGNPATVFPRDALEAAPSAQANQSEQEVRELRSAKVAAVRYSEQYGQPTDEGTASEFVTVG